MSLPEKAEARDVMLHRQHTSHPMHCQGRWRTVVVQGERGRSLDTDRNKRRETGGWRRGRKVPFSLALQPSCGSRLHSSVLVEGGVHTYRITRKRVCHFAALPNYPQFVVIQQDLSGLIVGIDIAQCVCRIAWRNS